MSRLILYLKDKPFQEMEIDIPEYKRLSNFKERVTLKEWYVNSRAAELIAMYTKQIIKFNYDYHVVLIVESKIKRNEFHDGTN